MNSQKIGDDAMIIYSFLSNLTIGRFWSCFDEINNALRLGRLLYMLCRLDQMKNNIEHPTVHPPVAWPRRCVLWHMRDFYAKHPAWSF